MDGELVKLETQECCPWPWSLFVLKEETGVFGHGLGLKGKSLLTSLGLGTKLLTEAKPFTLCLYRRLR